MSRLKVSKSQNRKIADLKKLSQKIEQESTKVAKQIAKLAAYTFDQPSSVMSKMKELESKIKQYGSNLEE